MPIPGQTDAVVFAPMPLLTGQVFETPEGAVGIQTVEMVITDPSGQAHRVRLEERHGAWWAPRALAKAAEFPPARPSLRIVPTA